MAHMAHPHPHAPHLARASFAFVVIAAAALLASCDDGDAPASNSGATAEFTSGIASGDVTTNSVVLWTRADGGDTVTAELARDPEFTSIVQSVEAGTSAERDFTVKVNVSSLDPETRYHYRFRAGDAMSPAGTFVTAPGSDQPRSLHFVFAGDSDGSRRDDGSPPYNEFDVLNAAAAESPDFFAYFGDTIYADRPPPATTLDGYRAKYRENRGYATLTGLLASTSMYTTWDDHEVVNDFSPSGVDTGVFEAGRQAFREYMPVADGADPTQLYRSFRWGTEAELIVLDERGYRSAPAAAACTAGGSGNPDPLPGVMQPGVPDEVRALRGLAGLPAELPAGCLTTIDDPSRTLLGAEQKAFLKQRLQASDATWKVVVNSVPIQMLLALPYDRWEGYAAERREILEFIRQNEVKNVVFLTTDFHANVYGPVRVDLFTDPEPVAYEAIVGPIAATPLREDIEQVVGAAAAGAFSALLTGLVKVDCAELSSYSYAVVDIDAATHAMTITSKDASGQELCKKELEAETDDFF